MMDWIMRRLFPRLAAERDAALAILDRQIAETRERLRKAEEGHREFVFGVNKVLQPGESVRLQFGVGPEDKS